MNFRIFQVRHDLGSQSIKHRFLQDAQPVEIDSNDQDHADDNLLDERRDRHHVEAEANGGHGVVGRQTASGNVVGLNDRDVLGALDARIGQDDRNPAAVALSTTGLRPLLSTAARMIASTLREMSDSTAETCSSTASWLDTL